MKKNTIETCLSPELIHLHNLKGKIVVIIDVFRATSVMVTAHAEGVEKIKPFKDVDDCVKMKEKGYLIAGERGGAQIEGFDLGNSPLAYLSAKYKDQKLAMTTTNGTLALQKSLEASDIIIGSFLNLSAVIAWVKANEKPVVLHCAGWKGRVNFEDTLLAGAITSALLERYDACDASMMAVDLYHNHEDDLLGFLMDSSHVKRLTKINSEIGEDIKHCCSIDVYNNVPVYKDDFLS